MPRTEAGWCCTSRRPERSKFRRAASAARRLVAGHLFSSDQLGLRRGPSRPDRRGAVGRRRRAVRRDLCIAGNWLHAHFRRDAQDQPVLCRGLDRSRLCEPVDSRRHQGARDPRVPDGGGGRRGHRRPRLSRRLQVHSARQSAGDPDVHRRPAAPDRRDHRAHDGGRAAQLSGAVFRRDHPGGAVQAARRSDVRLRSGLRVHGRSVAAALPDQAWSRHARRVAAADRIGALRHQHHARECSHLRHHRRGRRHRRGDDRGGHRHAVAAAIVAFDRQGA